MGELKDISICAQKPTLNTHTPIEYFPTAADVGRESRRDTRRDLRSAHWHLLLLRPRLVRRPHPFLFFVAELIRVYFPFLSHHVFQTSNIPARHFFIPMTFALGLIV